MVTFIFCEVHFVILIYTALVQIELYPIFKLKECYKDSVISITEFNSISICFTKLLAIQSLLTCDYIISIDS